MTNLNKRTAVRALLLSYASAQIPQKWTKPVVNSILLPSHAQTSIGEATEPAGSSGSQCPSIMLSATADQNITFLPVRDDGFVVTIDPATSCSSIQRPPPLTPPNQLIVVTFSSVSGAAIVTIRLGGPFLNVIARPGTATTFDAGLSEGRNIFTNVMRDISDSIDITVSFDIIITGTQAAEDRIITVDNFEFTA